MTRPRAKALVLSGALSLAGIGQASESGDKPAPGRLVLTGSSTIAPLALEIGKRFETDHPGVRVDVQTGGSSRGVADARSGLADIGMASRAAKADERDLVFTTVAMDGVAVIIHKDNPVKALTDDQLSAIYSGKTTNWQAVGGRDAKITVVNKAEGRSTLELFTGHFKLKNSDIKAHVVIGDNEQGIKTVAGNKDAIGYVSIGTAEYDASIGVPIKLLPLGGIEARVDNVKNGTYPLSRPLNLLTKGAPRDLAKLFLDYASSEKVNDLVKEQFFVPVTR